MVVFIAYYTIYILIGYGFLHNKLEVTYESENPPLRTRAMVAMAALIILTLWLPIVIASKLIWNNDK